MEAAGGRERKRMPGEAATLNWKIDLLNGRCSQPNRWKELQGINRHLYGKETIDIAREVNRRRPISEERPCFVGCTLNSKSNKDLRIATKPPPPANVAVAAAAMAKMC